MPKHDAGRRLLFSHRRMVSDLLEFIDEDWARDVRPGSLEPVQSCYVSSSLLKRRSDMVWKAKRESSGQIFYIPIEFQSRVERGMGLRWICYLGLFNQSLKNASLLGRPMLLAPAFPLVLYNGLEPWNAPLEVSRLYGNLSGGMEKHSLRLRYHVLEERLYRPKTLEGRRNVVACMLRLENSRSEEGFCKVVADLLRWFPEEGELLRDFAAWIVQVLLPSRAPECPLPKNIGDLTEVKAMLDEGVPNWTARWKEQGVQEGQALILIQLLEQKFGALSNPLRQQIQEADAAALKLWVSRLLEAGNVEEVFNGCRT